MDFKVRNLITNNTTKGTFQNQKLLLALVINQVKESTHMEIKKNEINEGVELILAGRLDTVTAPKLQTALSDALQSFEAAELDFTAIEYVSSAGLRVLLQGQKNAQGTGKSMKLKNVSTEVMEVFDVTGFTGILTII